jgi:TolB-like protein/DNA-binding winged helix-turn-helix (wHTH) protein
MNTSSRNASFGPYLLDVRSGELKKFGMRVKIGEQAFQILCLLLDSPGELVTREELRARLWPGDTFVDFDHGLNSAVQRLRDCLSDSATNPRWIETVPRRGYRFVGKVEWSEQGTNGKNVFDSANAMPDEASHDDLDATAAATFTGNGFRFVAPFNLEEKPATSTVLPSTVRHSRAPSLKLAITAALLLTAAAALTYTFRSQIFPAGGSHIQSIAVLPLVNLSGDKSQDYFADGMTDEFITALAKNRNLRVVSRTSAMQYKGVNRPLRDIARELGVDDILEGSIERSQNRVHMTVQLIHASTDTHLWAESYDRDLNQAFSLPEELSATVAKELKIAASPPPPRRYIDPEAHDAYLHGLHFRFGNTVRGGLPYFEKAIQLQPDYAAAWSGLSDTYGVLAIGGEGPSSEVSKKWESAARKAVELDDSLPEAHNSRALWYLFYVRDWQRAESESLRSLALDPRFVEGYHVHSYILTVTNRILEAIEEEKREMSIDPFARPWALGYAYYHARRYEDALNELRLCIAAQSSDPNCHVFLSDVYHFLGRDNEAIAELKESLPLFGKKDAVPVVQRAFERGGFAAVADWQADHYSNPWQSSDDRAQEPGDRNRPEKYISPFWRALATARAGRKAQTLQLLDEAYLAHDPRIIFLQNEPVFDFLHHEPRYQSLVQKLGLPPTS